MELNKEIQAGLEKASYFVAEGVGQILAGNLDETHGVSSSPGSTALAALALLAAGKGFESAQQRGVQWLRKNYQGGWGKCEHRLCRGRSLFTLIIKSKCPVIFSK